MIEQQVAGEGAPAPTGDRAPMPEPAPSAPALQIAQSLRMDDKRLLTRGIRKRRAVPIHGYVGLNGHFKTWSMIRDTLPSLAMGRRVLSTVAILDPATGKPHHLYEPFRSWSQLLDFRDGDVLLDEVTGIMDSRDQGMPKHVRRLLPQMRRANVLVRWTGIDWDNSDRRLRQLTQAVTKCRGHMPNHKLVRQSETPDALAMWAPNRLAFLTTYDAQTMTQSNDGMQLTQETEKKRKAKVLLRELAWAPNSLTFSCYNTLDPVLAVDNSCQHVDHLTGEVCGGKQQEKICRGHEGARSRRS